MQVQKRGGFLGSLSKLKNRVEKKSTLLRPPYHNGSEELFYKECISCEGVCSTFCKEGVLKIAEDKTPYIDFSKNGCTFCEECASACQQNVLDLENSKNFAPKFEISVLDCMAWNKVMCFTCKDACLDNAIEFLGLYRPEVNMDKCSSCGFCVSSCPSFAFKVGG